MEARRLVRSSCSPDDCGNATTDPTLVSDAFLVHMTTLTSLVSAAVDDASDTAQYMTLAKQLRAVFADEYITASGLLVAETQTALALAIYFSLFPSSTQGHAADRISLIIRRNSCFTIATGFAGTPFVGHALTKVGQSNLFYRMLLHRKNPSWLYPVTMGATGYLGEVGYGELMHSGFDPDVDPRIREEYVVDAHRSGCPKEITEAIEQSIIDSVTKDHAGHEKSTEYLAYEAVDLTLLV
ncbi:bacterial alpha-L-rhamnosidase-domain-containing protein [Lipomyces tetrasporus]